MGLVFGGSGYGKSFEAETAGAERPGRFRHVKTPIGNDDHSFFLALNKALGGLQNTRAKALELREHCEAALEAGDVVLVLDDAHRLWIQTNLRDNTPKRVEWVLQMADRGVPIILIACPQFFDSQGLAEDKVKWNTLQFDRRIGVAPQLHPPTGEDLRAVAASLLPGVSTDAIRALATVAGQSPGPLGTVDTIARRALHLASDAGAVGAAHVREAIKYAMATNAALAQAISHRRSKAGRRQESGQLGEASEAPAPAASPARGGTASHDLAGDCPAPVQLETTPRQTLPPAAPAPVSTG
jgi:hypothetical protein